MIQPPSGLKQLIRPLLWSPNSGIQHSPVQQTYAHFPVVLGVPRHPAFTDAAGIVSMVRVVGLEPTRSNEHKHLKLACLPIPAYPHIKPPETRPTFVVWVHPDRAAYSLSFLTRGFDCLATVAGAFSGGYIKLWTIRAI